MDSSSFIMFDTKKLIKCIHARPTIWKMDEISYSSRANRRRAWEEVAEEISDNWKKYTQKQKDQIVEELQKKWRNLKDYHIKLRKRGKNDPILKRRANYLNLLNFLDINIGFTNTGKKRRRSETDYDSDEYEKQTSSANVSHVTTEPTCTISEVIDTNAFQSSELNPLSNMNEDPDRSFLISILPDMKSMNERQKFMFKLEALKLIETIKYSKPKERQNIYDSVADEDDCIIDAKVEYLEEEFSHDSSE